MATHTQPGTLAMDVDTFSSSYDWGTMFLDVYPYDSITVEMTFTPGSATSFTFALLDAPASVNKVAPSAGWPVMKVEAGVATRDEFTIAASALVNNKASFTLNTKGLSRIKLEGKSNDGTGSAVVDYVTGFGPVQVQSLQPIGA